VDAADTVNYLASSYTVTVNQVGAQADPINTLPVNYTVVFSRAVGSNTFTTTDITQNGSASGITWALSTTDNITWNLSANAASVAGTIIPSIASNRVVDAFGNNNAASTSTDNSVTYDITAPTITYNSVLPANPSSELKPTVKGTVSEASTVALYFDSACTKYQRLDNSLRPSNGHRGQPVHMYLAGYI
jgi:hypothetical protein